MARKLQTTLAFAGFKATKGWQDLTFDDIEPKMAEHFRRKRPSSSGDVLSDSSSSTSDFQYPRQLQSSSPLKGAFFSDALDSSNGSTGHRKRTYNASFPNPSTGHRKRLQSSPSVGRSLSTHTSWKDQHQLSQSSPIKARKYSHFTTSAGPNISFSRGTSSANIHPALLGSDDEDDLSPINSNFKMPSAIRSSPPRTPPARYRQIAGNRNNLASAKTNNKDDGANLLLYLATSPSPAQNSRSMQPPSTPPSRALALPSTLMTTPGGGIPSFGAPQTPDRNWEFSEFLNITPSPAQPSGKWTRTPGGRTPGMTSRRIFPSPRIGTPGRGLGMQLGGELIP